eukprot:GAFH01002806.1.p4 GENE.GAFH01002806.1~~GAFH01002806.1.p4  ORF type:complete len:71 (+),score=3.91 GAFH01002806.1:713-925(+)
MAAVEQSHKAVVTICFFARDGAHKKWVDLVDGFGGLRPIEVVSTVAVESKGDKVLDPADVRELLRQVFRQ